MSTRRNPQHSVFTSEPLRLKVIGVGLPRRYRCLGRVVRVVDDDEVPAVLVLATSQRGSVSASGRHRHSHDQARRRDD
ncbi:hypothetical protein ACWDE9_09675 [Streptomyces olivaceoviridis]